MAVSYCTAAYHRQTLQLSKYREYFVADLITNTMMDKPQANCHNSIGRRIDGGRGYTLSTRVLRTHVQGTSPVISSSRDWLAFRRPTFAYERRHQHSSNNPQLDRGPAHEGTKISQGRRSSACVAIHCVCQDQGQNGSHRRHQILPTPNADRSDLI